MLWDRGAFRFVAAAKHCPVVVDYAVDEKQTRLSVPRFRRPCLAKRARVGLLVLLLLSSLFFFAVSATSRHATLVFMEITLHGDKGHPYICLIYLRCHQCVLLALCLCHAKDFLPGFLLSRNENNLLGYTGVWRTSHSVLRTESPRLFL